MDIEKVIENEYHSDDEDPVCIHCGEGAYVEEEWNLKLYTACENKCCKKEWYHVACFNEFGQCPMERYDGPVCIFCGEGPGHFDPEEVWHLLALGCCDKMVYHPACTVKLLKEVHGIFYYGCIQCPYCPGLVIK